MSSPLNRAATAALIRTSPRNRRRLQYLNRTARNLPDLLHYSRSAEPSVETVELARRLRVDGYVLLPRFLSHDAVTRLRHVVDALIDEGERVKPIMKLIKGYGHTEPAERYDLRSVDVSLTDPLTIDRAFVDFALDRRILDITNAYIRTYTALYDFVAWHNAPNELEALGSYNWHRDPEGPYLLKAFVYLNDVEQDSTHFTFVRGSHRGAAQTWDQIRSLSDEDMAALIPRTDWIHMLGPAGTVILADTNGYHKGTKGRKERYMLSSIYSVARTAGPAVDRCFVSDVDAVQQRALRHCRITG